MEGLGCLGLGIMENRMQTDMEDVTGAAYPKP